MNRPAELLMVRAGQRLLGLPVDAVRSEVDVMDPSPVPAAGPAFRGVIPAHGRLVPLFSLGLLLDDQAVPAGDTAMGVVMELEGRALCLEVDEALAVVSETLLPVAAGAGLPWASALVEREGDFIPVLDLELLAGQLKPLEVAGGGR
ncbi:MAG: chemotaxis protein CheW [Gemmatimonadales bacterium]